MRFLVELAHHYSERPVMATGRERRRTDLYGKVRRALYGLMLLLGAPHLAGAQDLAPSKELPALLPAQVATQTLPSQYGESLVSVGSQTVDGQSTVVYGELVERLSLGKLPKMPLSFGPVKDILIAAQFVDDDFSAVRYGFGMDFTLPAVGNFYLNLYSRDDSKRSGKRWELNPTAVPASANSGKPWNLGGTVELVKTQSGTRELGIVPQLVLDLDRLVGAPGQFEARIQYAHWQGLSDKEVTNNRMAQVTVNWRF